MKSVAVTRGHCVLRLAAIRRESLVRAALYLLLVPACAMGLVSGSAADAQTTDRAPATRDTSLVAPDWELEVDLKCDIAPRVVINAFADPRGPRRFPIGELAILRVTEHRNPAHGDSQGTEIQEEIARLQVAPDGQVDSPRLRFVESTFASVNPWSGSVTFLHGLGASESPVRSGGGDSAPDFQIDRGTVPGHMYRWEAAPDGTWGLEFTTAGAFLLTRRGAPTTPRVPGLVLGGQFCRDGSKYATALLHSIPEVNQWAVFGRDGALLHLGPARRNRIDRIEFTPDGKWLLVAYDRSDTVCVRLEDGKEQLLRSGWWSELDHYSADGQVALSMTTGPDGMSVATFTDRQDPLRPLTLGEPLEISMRVGAAALSQDGRLAAFEERIEAAEGQRRVTVYDRRSHTWTELSTSTPTTGLCFAGNYLFLGTWRGYYPGITRGGSTKRIRLYDLSGR